MNNSAFKTCKQLRTASLNLNFIDSYKNEKVYVNINLVNAISLAALKTVFLLDFDMQIQGVYKD